MWVGIVIRDYDQGEEAGMVIRTDNVTGSHQDVALLKQKFAEVAEDWHKKQEKIRRGERNTQDSSSG